MKYEVQSVFRETYDTSTFNDRLGAKSSCTTRIQQSHWTTSLVVRLVTEQQALSSDWLRGFGAAYNIPWGQSQVTIILTGQYKICDVSHIILTGQYKICDVSHIILTGQYKICDVSHRIWCGIREGRDVFEPISGEDCQWSYNKLLYFNYIN